jgi:hypothetical protein
MTGLLYKWTMRTQFSIQIMIGCAGLSVFTFSQLTKGQRWMMIVAPIPRISILKNFHISAQSQQGSGKSGLFDREGVVEA